MINCVLMPNSVQCLFMNKTNYNFHLSTNFIHFIHSLHFSSPNNISLNILISFQTQCMLIKIADTSSNSSFQSSLLLKLNLNTAPCLPVCLSVPILSKSFNITSTGARLAPGSCAMYRGVQTAEHVYTTKLFSS